MAKKYYGEPKGIKTHNNAALFKEKFSEPCGLPFGSHSVELEHGYNRHALDGVKVYDLYEGAEKMMQEDKAAARKMVKPHSW